MLAGSAGGLTSSDWELHAVLLASSLAGWKLFDGSAATLTAGLLTAVGGPLVEIALINVGHLYAYHSYGPSGDAALWYGIPPWIAEVYFLGGPVVGILSRWILSEVGASALRLRLPGRGGAG